MISGRKNFFECGEARLLKHIAFLCVAGLVLLPWAALAADATATSCARNISTTSVTPGKDIIMTIFNNINALLKYIGLSMYLSLIQSNGFAQLVKSLAVLYVAIYGVMVTFNLVSHRPGEVFGRVIKLAIVFALLAPNPLPFAIPGFAVGSISGYVLFDQFIGKLFMGGMNQLINGFTVAAYTGSGYGIGAVSLPTGSVPILDTSAIAAFYPAMDVVFSPFFVISILGTMMLGTSGMMFSGVMLWAFFDFIKLILHAIVTYVRGIVGLTFLFGIAPIFIAFLLFNKTRQLFFGWLSQVITFALTPVMMFAFLSFYGGLLSAVLTSMFNGIDFCFTSFLSIPGTPVDVGWWRPALWDGNHWVLNGSGMWKNVDNTDKEPAINPVNIIFFLMISHIGVHFCQHIEEIAASISNGVNVGVSGAGDIGSWMRSVGLDRNNRAGSQNPIINSGQYGAGYKPQGGPPSTVPRPQHANYQVPPPISPPGGGNPSGGGSPSGAPSGPPTPFGTGGGGPFSSA